MVCMPALYISLSVFTVYTYSLIHMLTCILYRPYLYEKCTHIHICINTHKHTASLSLAKPLTLYFPLCVSLLLSPIHMMHTVHLPGAYLYALYQQQQMMMRAEKVDRSNNTHDTTVSHGKEDRVFPFTSTFNVQ